MNFHNESSMKIFLTSGKGPHILMNIALHFLFGNPVFLSIFILSINKGFKPRALMKMLLSSTPMEEFCLYMTKP